MRRAVTQKMIAKRLSWDGHVVKVRRLSRRVEQYEETSARERSKFRWKKLCEIYKERGEIGLVGQQKQQKEKNGKRNLGETVEANAGII